MNRRAARRALATACAAVLAAGVLGVTVGSPAGAASRTQVATPPPPGSGATILVQPEPQPVGPLSFT